MTDDQKFPDHSYPCPICQQSLHIKNGDQNMYECCRRHLFELELNGAKRELRSLADTPKSHKKGETFFVDMVL
jgi:hypothetical protein